MNPYTPGTFWWARQAFLFGRTVRDETGRCFSAADTDDLTLRAARWDTVFRFTVADFEGRGWSVLQ